MNQTLPSLRRLNGMYALLQVAYWAMFASFAGYQTALLLGRGFSSGEAGVFAAIRYLAGIVSQPILGGWADRHPNVPLKRILTVCLAASLAATLAFYWTRPGFFGTALIIAVLGALELNAYPLLDSMAMQFINAGLNVNYSLGRGLGSFAYAVACVLLGQQSAALGVETVLLTHGVLELVLIAAIAAYPSFSRKAAEPRPTGESPHSVWYILKSNPPFSFMLLASLLGMAAVLPIVSFMVNIVTSRGGDDSFLGLALFLMVASEFPAAIIYPRLWRRLGSRGMMVLAVFFMFIKPLVFLLTPNLAAVMLVQPIQMLGYGLFTPSSVYYANENVSPVDRVRGQSVMMMASNGLGGMTGNLLAGFAIDWGGVSAMLGLCTLCGALGVACAFASVKLQRRRELCR